MNTTVTPLWIEKNYDWYLAIIQESSEALDHYGWKWWKKQEPNINQVKIELVDIWHFILSAEMNKFSHNYVDGSTLTFNNLDTISANIEAGYDTYKQYVDVDDFSFINSMKNLVRLATFNSVDYIHFFNACSKVGLYFDELFRMYVAKNALNIFRQFHGYKTGTYIKNWNGEEDNVYLEKLLDNLDEITYVNIMNKLEEKYKEII